jgi:hypothetical protein
MALIEALETQLAGLDADQLRTLLIGLVGDNPDLAAPLQQRLLALRSVPAPAAPLPAADTAAIRRAV